MGNNPSKFKDGDSYPVEYVSWEEARQFCESLNNNSSIPKPDGYRFSLPTEAQWEFACRGGNQSQNYLYSGSNTLDNVAWYSDNAGRTHPVGQKSPNELGFYDMSGNVWEWCQDNYSRYDGTPKKDPQGPQNSQKSFRVNRGGSWDYIASSARSCNRRNRTPDFRNFNLGMRLAE